MSSEHSGHWRAISGEVIVDAVPGEVYKAWTTEEGIKSFFAPACNVDLKVGGLYEIFFAPENPPGERGADGMRLLALEPGKMLSFTWNAPPHLPNVRKQRTHVVVRFEDGGEGRTRVTLRHDGWGEGEEWDRAFEYFDEAWNDVVLPRLRYRFSAGPVDWTDPPAVMREK
jgi:uncharacterized protein YndB with AHSA1/START domain